ncbi:MAG: D-cysteine desulfhydrase family protein, partial [Caulobacteraceae bacterium]
EMSGNKVRKLEYSVKEAVDNGCDCLITCGGIQSNHCRATAAAAAKLRIKSCLLLRGEKNTEPEGNLLLDKLLGAEVYFITAEEYRYKRTEIMEQIKREMETKGFKPYIIPEGASNGIGSFGYYTAMEEIIAQERDMNISFDGIVLAVGSGGTYSGLWLASKLLNHKARIYGINVCDNAEYFKERIQSILYESMKYMDVNLPISRDEIHIIDGYVGRGYALSRPEELNFIHKLAAMEGVILDPVYTGKAMYGLTEEIKKGRFKDCRNLLFIHTGGLFGLFPQGKLFGL